MNIVFSGKFSESAWHSTLRTPVHRQPLLDWIYGFLAGGWVDRETDLKLKLDDNGLYSRYDTYNLSGFTGELTVYCNPNDVEVGPHGPIAREFDWIVYAYPVDKYGTPDRNQGVKLINGGFINHSHDEFNPSWSSHT